MKTPYRCKLFRAMALLLSFIVFHTFAQKTPQQVIILHTNDMHARIDNMAKLAYLKDSLLKTNPLVFLVSSGDNFTGNPVVDMVKDKGYPMIDIMNRCGFDVSAIGNHEFDLGQEFLNTRIAHSAFPFICCNVDASNAVLHQPPAYVILNRGDSIHLVFLGVLELGANGLPDTHPKKLEGLKFSKGIDVASEYTYLKREQGNLIALSHLGFKEDKKMAEILPQIDVILGGHSHTLIDTAVFIEGVMIVQAGSFMRWIGKTTLTMQNDKILSKKDEIIPVSMLKSERKDVRDCIDRYNNNDELNSIVGEAISAIKGTEELGALMTDALRDQVHVEIAFQNRGGIRIDSLAAGTIRMKDIYKLDPFGNQVVVCSLSIAEIKSLISYSFNMNKTLDLEVSGMKYRVLTSLDGKCVDVLMQDENGKELEKRNYKVAMNSYIAAAYTFNHTGGLLTIEDTTAKVLIDYLGKMKTVDYHGVSRISTSIFK